jgi:glycosyltransferase involved in cell wall biosynthesis
MVMEKYRFHYPGLVHLPVTERYMGCAFTQKIVKLTKMLMSLGHEVFIYGCEGSDVSCTEFIQTHTLADVRREWGEGDNRFELGYDWKQRQFKHDFNAKRTETTMKFYGACIEEIARRKRPGDFLLLAQGFYHKPIDDAVGIYLSCEPGIGYRGSYPAKPDKKHFRAFESSYIMNYTYGSEHPREGTGPNGNYYDRVIPNYFDPKDFEFCDKKEDYYFYIGRMIIRKGVWTAVKATAAVGSKLILAGQVDPEIDVHKLPKHCEFIGYVEPKERTDIMKKAKAVFVPTFYLEPFAGTHIEAMICGTPVITTNFGVFPETVVNGRNGFRCDVLDDFVRAARDVGKLDPYLIRKYGERFLMDNVKWEYQKWFDDLYQVFLSTTGKGAGWNYIAKV